jgi:hypothetical protein
MLRRDAGCCMLTGTNAFTQEGLMKKLAAIAGLLLVASLAAAQTATVLTGPFDEALAKAKKENKLILIDFFSGG